MKGVANAHLYVYRPSQLLICIQKCDHSALAPFLKLLLVASRESGQFNEVYTSESLYSVDFFSKYRYLHRIFLHILRMLQPICDEERQIP